MTPFVTVSLSPALLPVRLVPLRAAPCFHILSLLMLSNLLWLAKQHSLCSLCACVQMAFAYTALAIILVCVFKRSEKLPLGVSVLKKVTAWVLEFGWTECLV